MEAEPIYFPYPVLKSLNQKICFIYPNVSILRINKTGIAFSANSFLLMIYFYSLYVGIYPDTN